MGLLRSYAKLKMAKKVFDWGRRKLTNRSKNKGGSAGKRRVHA